MLRGTKYLVASQIIIDRINEIKTIKNRVEQAKAEEEAKEKANADERESTIMCLESGDDDNIMCE